MIPSVQIFSVPFFNEHTNSPRPKKSHHFLSKTQQILPFFTNPLRTAPQLHCFTTFSIKTSPLAPQRQRRRAVLQHELDAHQPFLVGLQETRLQDSVLSPDQHYFILQASAKQDGSGGCALWLSKHVPYARAGVRSYYLQEQHFVVTGHSDRHINVSIAAPHLKLFVVVAHCPSLANHPQPIVEQLWRDRHAEIVRRPPGADYIVLVDANAQVGSIETDNVSGHQAECENTAGALFHEFLAGISACLPSTVPGVRPRHDMVLGVRAASSH